ncbi:MAG: NAD-dependent protein deacylase [Bacteroidales bacterium]|nr:NAD-dependent protein deacylase [Bacteroidales bacterium]
MKHIVVLTGAGVSAESGISTFRDNGGLWDKFDPNVVASIDGWNKDKGLLLDFYNIRRRELADVRPNAAHIAIAELQKNFNVDVITQNVDNLHERAGSSRVLHLHGELTKVRPENCYNDEDGFSEKSVFDIGYGEIHLGDKAPNGHQLRPHIVWFGEPVPKIGKAIDIVSEADILLIVGSSLSVYPAAGLYRYAPYEAPVYLIDPADVNIRDKRVRHIRSVASEGMQEFIRLVSE